MPFMSGILRSVRTTSKGSRARGLQRLAAVAGGGRLVALGLQDHLQDVALAPLVVDDQDAALSRDDGLSGGRAARSAQGQRDARGGALAGRALERDRARRGRSTILRVRARPRPRPVSLVEK